MKLLKVLLIFLFSLIILGAVGAYILLTHYKKELSAEVISALDTRYAVKLQVGDIRVSPFTNWPQVAVLLRNVKASGKRFKGSEFNAQSVSLSFNIRELLNKRFIVKSLAIKDGEILFIKHTDSLPEAPANKETHSDSTDDIQFEIKKIHLRNTHLRYLAPERGKDYDLTFIDNTIRFRDFTDGIDARMKGKVFVQGMVFRQDKGVFLDSTVVKLDLHANYFKFDKSLCIRPGSTAEIDGQRYRVISLVNFEAPKRIAVIINTRDIMIDQVRDVVNDRIRKTLRNYEVHRPMNMEALLVAGIGTGEEPVIIIKASTQKNKIRIGTGKIPYNDIAFSGKIVSLHPSMTKGDIKKATVTFQRISGKIYEIPFTASVKVKNLKAPYIYVNGKMDIDAAKIPFDLKNEFELKGKAHAYIRYSGPASKINRHHFLSKSMRLSADLDLFNFSYREKKRPYVYTLNGSARVDNNNVSFDKLGLTTAVGVAELKGTAHNFVNYVLGISKGFKANLVAHTDSFNLNPVLMREKKVKNERIAAQEKLDSLAPPGAESSEPPPKKENALLANKDNFSTFDFDVDLYAKKMLMRKVYAEDAFVSMNYRDEKLDIKSLQLYTCDGKIAANGTIENFNRVKADISVENLDVKKMFRQFENFGQDAILSENLKGKIYVQASFSSMLDDQLEVIGETMIGEVRLSLKDGQLVNFEPIQKLSNFLFKNRDFNNVSFSELNETFQVRGYEMTINELEIGSNILNLYVVNGTYNFKGESNINVLLPWSNLKKRGKDHVPRISGKSVEDVKGVKLNFSGPSNNIKVSLGHKEQTELKPSI